MRLAGAAQSGLIEVASGVRRCRFAPSVLIKNFSWQAITRVESFKPGYMA
jgi:hypothetical protein